MLYSQEMDLPTQVSQGTGVELGGLISNCWLLGFASVTAALALDTGYVGLQEVHRVQLLHMMCQDTPWL